MFELKKIVSAFSNASARDADYRLVIGLLLLLWFTRRKGTGVSFFISFAFLGIFLLSFQPIATSLLRPLEKAYPPYVPCRVKRWNT